MVGIVVIHLDSYFRYYHPDDFYVKVTLFLSNASRFCVPAFIISSAFFLNYKSTKDYWVSKWKNLVIPYLVIGTIAYISKYPVGSKDFIFDYVFKLATGTIMAPYYFVPLLIQCYFLYAVFLRRVEKSKTSITLLLIFSLMVNAVANADLFSSQNIYWNAFSPAFFTNFIFFFLVGFTSKNLFLNSELFSEFVSMKKFFLYTLAFCLFAYLGFVGYLTLNGFPEISNHFLFYPLGMFVLLFAVGLYLENSQLKIFRKLHFAISFIGKNSLSIFLIHPILIHFSFGNDPYLFGGPVIGYLFFLSMNTLVPIFIWKLFEKAKRMIVA